MRIVTFIILLIIFIGGRQCYGQDQEYADSLISVYFVEDLHGEDRLEILYEIAVSHPEPSVMLAYSKELIEIADSLNASEYLVNGYMAQGFAEGQLGQYFESLRSNINAYELAKNAQLNRKAGMVAVNLADLYSKVSDHKSARRFYQEGLETLRQEKDTMSIASTLFNLGDDYYKTGSLDSALLLYEESIQIFRAIDVAIGVAYNLGNIGQVKHRYGQINEAEKDLKEAIQMLEEVGDLYGASTYLLDLARIFLDKGDLDSALVYASESMTLANSFDLMEQISDANLVLSEIYNRQGLVGKSMKYYKDHVELRDSINRYFEIGNLSLQFEMAQKQTEVDLLRKEAQVAELRGKRQQWGIAVTALALLLVAVLGINIYRRFMFTRKTNKIIVKEKNRSEELLLNILPREAAAELREKGEVQARKIANVTVLFTDFIEFTRHAEKESPELMVRSIDYYFKRFDEITTRYNLEKIKTIGDSYMCAGGLHTDNCQAKEVIKAALEMITVLNKAREANDELIHFDVRIGVHTGPVVAGIVGNKKWQYDIWGDTVNIASGMEEKSESGRVNISQATYEEVKEDFHTEYRGESKIKNRGVVKMYFVG